MTPVDRDFTVLYSLLNERVQKARGDAHRVVGNFTESLSTQPLHISISSFAKMYLFCFVCQYPEYGAERHDRSSP